MQGNDRNDEADLYDTRVSKFVFFNSLSVWIRKYIARLRALQLQSKRIRSELL